MCKKYSELQWRMIPYKQGVRFAWTKCSRNWSEGYDLRLRIVRLYVVKNQVDRNRGTICVWHFFKYSTKCVSNHSWTHLREEGYDFHYEVVPLCVQDASDSHRGTICVHEMFKICLNGYKLRFCWKKLTAQITFHKRKN